MALLTGIVAVSPQSLWIDEAHSALKAVTPDFRSFSYIMQTDIGSDLQMPLYMLMLWAWEKIFGASEFALRAMNIPLFVLAIAWTAGRTAISAATLRWFVLLACVSPMVWAYLDEARPYTLQFLGGALVLSALVNLAHQGQKDRPKTSDAVAAAIGALILCGASLLGVIFTFFFGLAFLVLWFRAEPLGTTLRRPALWGILAGTFVCLAALGLYYAWTLSVGARASGAARTNALSLIFCGYELAGLAGAGPGRADLRSGGAGALVRYAPGLLAYAAALSLWMLACLPTARHCMLPGLRKYAAIVATAAISLTAVIALGLVAEFRLLGRHLIPLLPFGLLGAAALSAEAFAQASLLRKFGILLLPTAMLVSSLTLRFSPIHAKDDYRGAAEAAAECLKKGKVVWWAADAAGANYYSLHPITFENTTVPQAQQNIFFSNSRSLEYLLNLPSPDLIILSKPDIYDKDGNLYTYLQDFCFHLKRSLPGILLWERVSDSEFQK